MEHDTRVNALSYSHMLLEITDQPAN